MKRTVLFMMIVLFAISGKAQNFVKPKIYVNPITYSDGSNVTQAECLSASNNYLMGISKAKHVRITQGREKISIQTAKQRGYDYLLKVNVNSMTSKKNKPLTKNGQETYTTYTANCVIGHELISVESGTSKYSGTITGQSTDEFEKVARYESTTKLNNSALAMIDDVIPITATQINIEEADDDRVETAIINLGSEIGARKGMMFVIQQTKGSETIELATGRLEQILGKNSSRLNIFSKKGGEKKLLEAMNNADENTVITAKSRALNSMAAWGKDVLKNFGMTNEDKGDTYPSDINRTKKLKVAINHIYYGIQISNEASDAFAKAISESFTNCSTIEPGHSNAKTIEDATAEGWDALIDITITNASSKRGEDIKTKDGSKPVYIGSVTLSLYAINVATQAGINLRNIKETSSGYTPEEAIANAFDKISKPARKFFEDVFPVESKLETVTKFNKKGNDAKEASLSIGSNLGVKKNMKFDIYKQNLSVGEDSRENIGHGEIKKDPEQDSSILVIQDGGKEIATILQGDDPNVGIVVVSRGHIDKVGNVFKRFGLGGLF